MAKKRNRRVEAKPPLFERLEVDRHPAPNGYAFKVGQVIRRPAYVSPTLGVEVATVVGRIERIYQRRIGGPVTADIRMDRDHAAAGLASVHLDRCKHSQARVRGTTAEDWYGKEEKS